MPSRSARLLCAGRESESLVSRCAVLGHSGYDAQAATLEQCEALLHSEEFDLVIVSAWLSEWERGRILPAAGSTPTLVLAELTLADQLLAEVKRMLPPIE
jgi:hypothetical protein